MRKEASTYCIITAILGAFGLLLRWLQCSMIFSEESDLALTGKPISWLMSIVLVGVIVALWKLAGKTGVVQHASQEPEIALVCPNGIVRALLVLASLVSAAGAVLLFFQTDDLLLKLTVLVGLLAAPVLMLYPSLPSWGAVGAAFSAVPVAFYCLWMVVSYKDDAVNPVMWSYVVEILAVAAGLFALFHLCAYLFFRAKPRKTVFACGLATVYSMIVLAESSLLSQKLLFGGWGFGLAVLSWLLIANFKENTENY